MDRGPLDASPGESPSHSPSPLHPHLPLVLSSTASVANSPRPSLHSHLPSAFSQPSSESFPTHPSVPLPWHPFLLCPTCAPTCSSLRPAVGSHVWFSALAAVPGLCHAPRSKSSPAESWQENRGFRSRCQPSPRWSQVKPPLPIFTTLESTNQESTNPHQDRVKSSRPCQSLPSLCQVKLLPHLWITVDYVADSSILLLWITVDCVVEDYCGLRCRFVDMDWIWNEPSCVLLVTLTLVLCFLCALLRVPSPWQVLCCKFTMVSQPYCVWVLDKGVDVG